MPYECNYQRVVRHILHFTCSSWNHTGLAEGRAKERDLQLPSRLMEKSTMLFGRLLRVEGIIERKGNPSPMTDLHLDGVWALATKRDPATQLDLCEQRSKTTLEGTVAQRGFPMVATKYLARPLSRRQISNG